jgi:hypothetical protein
MGFGFGFWVWMPGREVDEWNVTENKLRARNDREKWKTE